MNLIIYSCCRESDRNSNEEPLKVEWSEEVPDVGQSVSMGDQRRWFKVKVDRYQATEQHIDVYLVYVNRTLSTPVVWDCEGCENETIRISLSENTKCGASIGEPMLEFAFNVLGHAPQVGARLMNYERTDHPTLMREIPSEWVVDRFDEFLPEGEAPYRAVHICWCQQLAIA